MIPVSERFWPKVCKGAPDECWKWIGAMDRNSGYGFIRREFARAKVHRLSWEIHNGPIPSELNVLHRCDNSLCVNPAHLYLGTRADSARDRALRKRGKEHRQNGEANDNAKLNTEKVFAIISAADRGQSQRLIAQQFGVSQSQVSRIKRFESWSHLSAGA